jgi:hypothetical protein
MRSVPARVLAAALVLPWLAGAAERKLTPEERVELIRGLTAENATAKTLLPRSKTPLLFDTNGNFDAGLWARIEKQNGPAARVGDLVKITRVTLESDRIVLEINGGLKGGRKWWERIQVGMGTSTTPISSGSQTVAPSGTTVALVFPGRVTPMKADEVKKVLAPIMDFNQRSASEQYVETLPPEIQEAIKDKKAIEGMNRDQVILALGRPDSKVRETVNKVELEDWIYGRPPGRVVFVTFQGDKVVRVRESYAAVGGSVAPPIPSPR